MSDINAFLIHSSKKERKRNVGDKFYLKNSTCCWMFVFICVYSFDFYLMKSKAGLTVIHKFCSHFVSRDGGKFCNISSSVIEKEIINYISQGSVLGQNRSKSKEVFFFQENSSFFRILETKIYVPKLINKEFTYSKMKMLVTLQTWFWQ